MEKGALGIALVERLADGDYEYHWVNRALAVYNGLPAAKHSTVRQTLPDIAEAVIPLLDRAVAGEVVHADVEGLNAAGVLTPFAVEYRPAPTASARPFVLAYVWITDPDSTASPIDQPRYRSIVAKALVRAIATEPPNE